MHQPISSAPATDCTLIVTGKAPEPLPVELEVLISQFCPRDTLVELSVVSRSWHRSAEPALYKHVRIIWDPKPLTGSNTGPRLLWDLAQNPRRAVLVRMIDASFQRYPERWEDTCCQRCEHEEIPHHCTATIAPYPTELVRGLIESRTPTFDEARDNQGHITTEAHARIWAIASRRVVACGSAVEDNRLVFWSSLYLALRACTNLRAVLFPVGDFSPVITPYCIRLLAQITGPPIRVLQVPLEILEHPITGSHLRQINSEPATDRIPWYPSAERPFVLVVDKGQKSRQNDLSLLAPFSRPDMSVIVVCARRNENHIDIIPAFYSGNSYKSMDVYFQDVGVYLDWRQELESRGNRKPRPWVWVRFHPSQLPQGLNPLVQALCKLGSFFQVLVIQATDRVQPHNTERSDTQLGPSITADLVARAIDPLQHLELLGIQDFGVTPVFPFTTEELTEAVHAIGMPAHLEVEVEHHL